MSQAEEEFVSKFKRGVSLIHKFDKSLYYSVTCDCGTPDCGAIIEIEVDEEFGLIEIYFHKNIKYDYWTYSDPGFLNFIKRHLHRWKGAIKLIFTGEITLQDSFVLIDIEHINNFIEALQEGRDYCLKVKEKDKAERETIKQIEISGTNCESGESGTSGVFGKSGISDVQDFKKS